MGVPILISLGVQASCLENLLWLGGAGRDRVHTVRRRTQSGPLAHYDRCVGTAKHGEESRLLFITPVNSLYHISFYVLARV